MPLTIPTAGQQVQVHIQVQVQEYERKHEVCTRVINETTLRIYLPRVPNANAVLSSGHSTATTFISQEEAINIQRPPLIINPMPTFIIYNDYTIQYNLILLNLFILQTRKQFLDLLNLWRGYESYPRKSVCAGRGGILNVDTCY